MFALEIHWCYSQATSKTTTKLLLTLTRLPALVQHSHPHFLSAGVTEFESSVILSAAEVLTGEDSQSKEEIISGFFSGEGELEGISCKDVFLPDSDSNPNKIRPPDSRLIEIAQVVAHLHQHPSEEVVAEGVLYDPASGVDTTGHSHSHTGGLLFVHESELENEIDAPAVGDTSPVDEVVLYEVVAIPEQQLAEVSEPVSMSIYRQGNSADMLCHGQTQPSGPIDWSAEDDHDLPPISGLQESFGGEVQPTATVVDDQAPPAEEGFTTHGGRGRGPRGERRGGRGGFRGEGRGYTRGGSYGDRGGRGRE